MDFTDFNELCQNYTFEIGKLLLTYDNTSNRQTKFDILSDFAKRYTLPPIYWKRLLKLAHEMFLPAEYEIWSHRALSQFRILELTRKLDKHWQWNNLDMIKQQILNLSTIENGLKMCEEAFKYPHKSLKDVFSLYCENLLKPLSKSVEEDYKNSLKLWKKLESVKNDPKLWLKLLEQIEDKNVVIANMELILSLDTNWAKKGFWLKLIGILKEEKSRHLLNVFSRYNRLFIDDIQKRQEYRATIEAFGNIGHSVSEYWLDTISFEFQFVGQESAYHLIQQILTSMVQNSKIPAELGTLVRQENSFEKTFEFYKELFLNVDQNVVPVQQPMMITKVPRKIVHFQNPSNQQLCFRNPLIRYILKNSKAKTLRNFFQTCKYFYALQSTPICYRFLLQTNSTFSMKQESLFLSENEINNFAMSNFYVSNYFTCISENPRILSQVIPKIYKSDAEFYYIENQVIYLDELEKLIPFQSAKTLSLLNCSIIDRNDAIINHPTILNMFLKRKN